MMTNCEVGPDAAQRRPRGLRRCLERRPAQGSVVRTRSTVSRFSERRLNERRSNAEFARETGPQRPEGLLSRWAPAGGGSVVR